MNDIMIKKFSPELIDDYLFFFDNIGFSDHEDWSWCYCTGFHFDDKDIERIHNEKKLNGTEKTGMRDEAISLINDKTINGYFAYQNDKVVGWCNINKKDKYKRIMHRKELCENMDNDNIKSIVCFLIAPHMRGKGVATKILAKICEDSKNDGTKYIESYPSKNGNNCFEEFPGPIKLYEKNGFTKYKELENEIIMRKEIII
jgi:ribosomal protein S18 acetylase RimI-like enzyme